ncbi:MAG: hypothetical protein WD066_11140 [Planctomycetaceae bacterium]
MSEKRREQRMLSYLYIFLWWLALLLMGIKALTPAGIELTKGRKLPRRVSTILGICVIVIATGIAISVSIFAFVESGRW